MAGLQGLLAMGVSHCLGGWLIKVETSGHPGHPPSTQLDAVVNPQAVAHKFTSLFGNVLIISLSYYIFV